MGYSVETNRREVVSARSQLGIDRVTHFLE